MTNYNEKTTPKNPKMEKEPRIVIVYATTQNKNEAKKIGKTLVDKKMVACVNILPRMHAIYRWRGVVEEATECIMLAKTQKKLVNQVIGTIKSMHSYELPCIIVTPVLHGLEEYLKYIMGETESISSK